MGCASSRWTEDAARRDCAARARRVSLPGGPGAQGTTRAAVRDRAPRERRAPQDEGGARARVPPARVGVRSRGAQHHPRGQVRFSVDPEDDKQKQRVVVLQQVALTPQHDDGVLGKVFARCYGVRRGDDRAMDASAEAAEHVHLVVRNVFTSAQSLALRVDPRTRMGELKRRMSLEFPLSPAVPTQKLIFGGKICRDDEPLAQVQISHLKDGDAGSDEPVVFHLLVNAPASARKSAELKPQLHFLPTRHLREVGLLQLVGERVAFAFNAAVGK
ncbi:hypothetical protein PR003_g6910 [Phytophthora rubi]|uniref:Ubiquitin-like domain-containing protein n=1 Tax=Phytophthora rubi TaxID=129364 RepID=A0A6A3NEW2_9STRA|nr:hypothetical protein PR002_g5789 [Phytophthora rubi]KAE9347476.1 hypothetical protein PR003_g6910 [Phytophthora rubi]